MGKIEKNCNKCMKRVRKTTIKFTVLTLSDFDIFIAFYYVMTLFEYMPFILGI